MTAMHEQPHLVASFNPALVPRDPCTALWLAEVTLRLRRELAWCWHLADAGTGSTALPPSTDPLTDSLDRLRHHDARGTFMADDVTARYLGEQIALTRARRQALPEPSPWQRLAATAGLDDTAQFVLTLALAARVDAAFGPVAAALEGGRSFATLALAQRLWDDPLAVMTCSDPAHALYRHALLRAPGEPGAWQQALELPAPLAAVLLDPQADLPAALQPFAAGMSDSTHPIALAWLAALPPTTLQVVPLLVPPGADAGAAAAAWAAHAGRSLVALAAELPAEHAAVPGLAAAAWIRGHDVLAPATWAGQATLAAALQPLAALPLRLWLPCEATADLHALPRGWLTPAIEVPALTLAARHAALSAALPESMAAAALEAARRFRLNERALGQVITTLRSLGQPQAAEVQALCRIAATLALGGLAQPVEPRFALNELVLPPRQQAQLQAIVSALRMLATVHHGWGTAKAWNEAGLAVLFCGPPGTGKTMAAEALATELALPMFRIDLSQVVNKYIGETEKNLRRIFDAAEAADCLLFFDEADALFGKRTEVKDAHDRYANLEVSYLLERMERFKGLAVLATNRRKDLDEAFSRRLRFIVDFPLPGVIEREALWRAMFPPGVDTSSLDLPFVARRFELAGGPIRSAAFNACLDAAASGKTPTVQMPHLLLAIKRELEKAGRETAREQFGPYAHLLPEHA